MKFYFEERFAFFVILSVAVSSAIFVSYVRQPQLFAPADGGSARDKVTARVFGAVGRPGDYRLGKGATARDAAAAAEPAPDADTGCLDYAIPLADGEVVYVPRAGEPVIERERRREAALKKARQPVSLRRIDINKAGVEELATLPGVGRKLAETIVMDRARALFETAADIRRVPGIGPKKYERIKDHIMAGSPGEKD